MYFTLSDIWDNVVRGTVGILQIKLQIVIKPLFLEHFLHPVFLFSTGGEASGHKSHPVLSNALWESPVQQPSVEELEHTGFDSDGHHREQLQRHEGEVCIRHA